MTNRLEDPWKDWKDARLRTFHHRKWLYLVGVFGFAALLYRAVRGFAAWEAAALSALLIAVVPELTSYYYAFLIVLALLCAKRKQVGLALLAVTAATGFIDWAPTQFLPRQVSPGCFCKCRPGSTSSTRGCPRLHCSESATSCTSSDLSPERNPLAGAPPRTDRKTKTPASTAAHRTGSGGGRC